MADLTIDERVYRKTATQSLATPLSVTTAVSFDWQLAEVLVNLDATTNVDVALTFDSKDGVNYDTVLFDEAFTGKSSLLISVVTRTYFQAGDELKVIVTRTGGAAATAYVTIIGLYR